MSFLTATLRGKTSPKVMVPNMALLKVSGISRTVRLPDDSPLTILESVDLSVAPGEHVAIVGRSGTGKSTLLNILGLLDKPSSGEYFLDGTDMRRASARRRTQMRGAKFGFVFQQFNLLPGRSALANVTAPLLYARGRQFFDRTHIATQVLTDMGLGERLDSTPDQLSGGEQQRVAIARAVVRGPQVILADEPTGALDVETGAAVMGLLEQKAQATQAALITITHDLAVAARADRRLRLDHGVLTPIPDDPKVSLADDAVPGPTPGNDAHPASPPSAHSGDTQ